MPLKIRWKMPLKIHDDFWGVDFWCAIVCPYSSGSDSDTIIAAAGNQGAAPGSRSVFAPTLRDPLSRGNEGGSKGMGVVSDNWFRSCFTRFLTSSSPHVDRCPNPLPWDPLSSPKDPRPPTSAGQQISCFRECAKAVVTHGGSRRQRLSDEDLSIPGMAD